MNAFRKYWHWLDSAPDGNAEKLISAGRVTVNGKVIQLGDKADSSTDSIQVDHKPIKVQSEKIYIALNKPRGVLSDRDPAETRRTIFDLVPQVGHIFAVGRSGL